ncbi:MAG: lysophospholipid acyltransferase family protein [Microscillaceae bacterium]|nr:lysophospholipid acyltransferase family protein [Microscillaceae bacterium]
MIVLIRGLSRIPLKYLYRVSDFLFLLTFYVFGYRKKVVLQNLRKSFPEKTEKEIRQIARGFYLNLCDIVVESISTYSIAREELSQRVRVSNPEVMRHYLERGQSVLLCGAHQCNWEWVSVGCAIHLGKPMDPLYKPLKNKKANDFMLYMRSRLGQRPIPIGNTLKEMRNRRNEVCIFGFAADQAPPTNEPMYWTNFLNQDTGFYVGIEKTAYLLKYPVVFSLLKRIKRGYYELSFETISEPPYEKDSHQIIERYIQITEQQILDAPSDWLWSHKRWKRPRVKED